MIDQSSFNELKTKYPVLSSFPDKLQNIISEQLVPNAEVINIYTVSTEGKKACIVLSGQKMVAYWMSKFLFMKVPTYQEFNYLQVNEMQDVNDTVLFIHASADAEILDNDYEEGEFTFVSASDKNEVSEMILSKASRLT